MIEHVLFVKQTHTHTCTRGSSREEMTVGKKKVFELSQFSVWLNTRAQINSIKILK